MLDFVIFHHSALGYNFFQKQTKSWNIPLTITQRVKRPPLSVVAADFECVIEGAARGEHAEILVEHQERFANGIDDRLRKCTRFLDRGEQFIVDEGGLPETATTKPNKTIPIKLSHAPH